MSQQAAAGWGMPTAGHCGKARHFFRQRGVSTIKGFKSAISKIANNIFNMGRNQFTAQFTQLQKNVANYLQGTASNEGFLVAETVRTGK
jgi:hypothetical protein